jgi:pimeloyl-ACP methyl ester carboxylesterase
MELDIRYATAADGVRIAHTVRGEGAVLVHMPNIGISMLQLERDIPARERWIAMLAQRFTLVRYDPRGTGFSQRDAPDVSVEAHLLDLEAVVDALGLETFALFGFLASAYIAPSYAARAPERVSRLILWPPDTRSMSSQEYQGLAVLARNDWETFTETYAHLAAGWVEGDVAHRYAQVLRESISEEMFLQQMAAAHVPTSHLLTVARLVSAPTLVLQRTMRFAGERIGRLVAALPDARLQILEGPSTVPYLGDVRTVVEVMARFAGGSGDRAAPHARGEQTEGAPALEFTQREREVLRLLTEGRSNEEIAEELVLSVRTVERHLYNIYNKIGASGKSARAFAAAYATRAAARKSGNG